MALVAMATSLLVAGFSTPKLPNTRTAHEQFSRRGYAEKRVRENFLRLGAGDEIKRLYGLNVEPRKP